jgi:hypothetical protein
MIPFDPQLAHPHMMTFDDDYYYIFSTCSIIVTGCNNSYSKITYIFKNGDIGTTTTKGL